MDENGKLASEQIPDLEALGAIEYINNLPFTRKNLLDNWYFADPIDQRGGYVVPPETAYYSDTVLTTQVGTLSGYANVTNVDGVYGTVNVSGTVYYIDWTNAVRGYCGGAKFTIDRWKSSSARGVIFVEDGTLKIESTAESTNYAFVFQPIENGSKYFGETLTFSVLDADGELHTLTSVLVDGDYTHKETSFGEIRVGGDGSESWGELYAVIGVKKGGNSKSFIAAKLELGDTQTLAYQDENGNWVLIDPPPNRALELAKCQRYQVKGDDGYRSSCLYANTSFHRLFVAFPTTMRATPQMTKIEYWGDAPNDQNVVACKDGFWVEATSPFLLKNYFADANL